MRYTQPQSGPIRIDPANPLAISDIWVGSSLGRTVVKGNLALRSGGGSSPTTVIEGVGPGGRFIRGDGTTVNVGLQINGNSNNLLDNSNTTWFIVRRCRDTTVRSSYMHYGYDLGGGNRAFVGAPDGTNLTWDYGNATAGSGRLQTPYTKDTRLETLVLVAGQTKGREIWRRGVKLASDPNAKAVRSADSAAFGIGPIGNGTPFDDVETYLFGISNREWSDAEIVSWCANPWQLFRSPQRVMLAAAGAGTSYSYTATGGFTLSGSATKVRGAVKTASGGVALSGAATQSRGAVRSAAGGIQLAGAASMAKGRAITASGGLSISGAATILRGVARSAAGGLQLAGAASVTFFSAVQTRVVTPIGGITIRGAATVARSVRYVAAGGIQLAGHAVATFGPLPAFIGSLLPAFIRRRRR